MSSDDESYQALGQAVITQAARDMQGGLGRIAETARSFLRGSPEFFFWCGVAEVEAERVRDKIFAEIDGKYP